MPFLAFLVFSESFLEINQASKYFFEIRFTHPMPSDLQKQLAYFNSKKYSISIKIEQIQVKRKKALEAMKPATKVHNTREESSIVKLAKGVLQALF